jgi:hypothetical protein
LNWDVQQRYPGITSLFREFSYVALAGSLLPCAASLRVFIGLDTVPAFAAALAGFTLTLIGATLLEWLVSDVRLDGPLPDERLVLVRLESLQEIVAGIAWRAGTRA